MEIRDDTTTVEIDPEKIAALEALPDTNFNTWTPEEDEILRRYWPVKKQADVAKVLGRPVATCKHRYEAINESDT